MSTLALPCPRYSRRTGRPVRRYNDVIGTTVKALDFNERAIRKLVTKWPQGAECGLTLESWPRHLAAILVSVLAECGVPEPLLGYTPPNARAPQPVRRGRCSRVAVPARSLAISDLSRVMSRRESEVAA